MRLVDLIKKKRDGGEHTRQEIDYLVSGYAKDEFPDYQMSAWLMAVVLKKMSRAEIAFLTEAMLHSGAILDFSDLPAKKVDKHSTGGIGDKTSMILAPIVAAGGVYVPMISGRGLGHTGGTLDKLEAIQGFNVNLSARDMRAILEKTGVVMLGQNADIVPADKKMYALRDVTGTVESPALICASIMSKKLAEGIDALVLDVKTGGGAFMKKEEDAVYLAELMVETGERMNKRVVAVISDMSQPLGRYVGNALEMEECIHMLRGDKDVARDLYDLTLELCGWMFYLGERSQSVADGKELAVEMIASGKALKKFEEMCESQGGDAAIVRDLKRLPQARSQKPVPAGQDGFVTSIQCEQIGIASLVLGAGRETKEDRIDPAVGLTVHKKIGDRVKTGEPLCTLYYNADEHLEDSIDLIKGAYGLSDQPGPDAPALIRRVIVGGTSGRTPGAAPGAASGSPSDSTRSSKSGSGPKTEG